jgi:hypothetical protein
VATTVSKIRESDGRNLNVAWSIRDFLVLGGDAIERDRSSHPDVSVRPGDDLRLFGSKPAIDRRLVGDTIAPRVTLRWPAIQYRPRDRVTGRRAARDQ